MKPSICVLGAATQIMKITVKELPLDGEEITAEKFHISNGGKVVKPRCPWYVYFIKGINQAIAASRLGAYVRFAGQIGEDQAGRNFINGRTRPCYLLLLFGLELKKEQINTLHITKFETHTGTSIRIRNKAKKSGIQRIEAAGANAKYNPKYERLSVDYEEGIGMAGLLLLSPETPSEINLLAAKYARNELSIPAAFDIIDSSYRVEQDLLYEIDFLFLRESELTRWYLKSGFCLRDGAA